MLPNLKELDGQKITDEVRIRARMEKALQDVNESDESDEEEKSEEEEAKESIKPAKRSKKEEKEPSDEEDNKTFEVKDKSKVKRKTVQKQEVIVESIFSKEEEEDISKKKEKLPKKKGILVNVKEEQEMKKLQREETGGYSESGMKHSGVEASIKANKKFKPKSEIQKIQSYLETPTIEEVGLGSKSSW